MTKFGTETEAEGTLARLIAQIDTATFRTRYLEREPLLVERRDPVYFAGLPTLDDIDWLLSNHTFRQQDLRLADSEATVKPADYMTGSEVDRGKLFARFQKGASIVFERLDRMWSALLRLCRGVERGLRQPTQANAYMTPGRAHGLGGERAQALKRHYDTHDVFVLQVAGRKSWTLFDPAVELPRKSQSSETGAYDHMAPRRTFDLPAGDTLYLPRGFVHEAHATEETALHITLGVIAYTWADLLAEAVSLLVETDPALRRALPRDALHGEEEEAGRETAFRDTVQRLAGSDAMVRTWAKIDAHFVLSPSPLLDGQLAQLAVLPRIAADTVVTPRRMAVFDIVRGEESVVLLYNRARAAFPGRVKDALRFAVTTPHYRVRDIPGNLDEAGQLVLVRRFVRDGMLTVHE